MQTIEVKFGSRLHDVAEAMVSKQRETGEMVRAIFNGTPIYCEGGDTSNTVIQRFWSQRNSIPRNAMDGMTPRDYFAAAALTGLIARQSDEIYAERTREMYACDAYHYADAMMDARTNMTN